MPPHWVDFDLGNGALLGIHPETDDLRVPPGSNSNGFAVDDVDAFVAGVEARGVRVIKRPADESFGRLAIILDADGYAVQVYTPAARQGHIHGSAGGEDDSSASAVAQESPVPA